MSGLRDNALRHMAFSTCAAFCKRTLQNARRATRFAEILKTLILQAFSRCQRAASPGRGGCHFGP
jgi:hypothetical protein